MAVLSCNYHLNPIRGSSDERNRGTYYVRYQIETDSVMGPKELTAGALSASPVALPAQWDTYSFEGDADSNAFAQRYEVDFLRPEESRLLYVVEVTFAPLPEGVNDVATWTNADPLSRPAIYWWEREYFNETVERDIFGRAILNGANDDYDEPTEQEASRGVLVVQFNVGSLAEVVAIDRQYCNAVNSLTWTKFNIPPRVALCREIQSGQTIREGAFSYFAMQFRFAFKENGLTWDTGILNQGFHHYIGDAQAPGGKRKVRAKVDIWDPKSADVLQPILLTADGFPLNTDVEPPNFTFWRTRREVNFNNIPIP